jgi:hypothetical protein
MTEKMQMNIYRCGNDVAYNVPHGVRTMGTTIAEARRSLGCQGCKLTECGGPVLWEDPQNFEPAVKQAEPPLKKWRSGIPPQGKYLLDTGEEQHKVNVGHGIFEREGEVHPISFAFASGTLWGPIREKKEEKEMKKSKKAKESQALVNVVDAAEKALDKLSVEGPKAVKQFTKRVEPTGFDLSAALETDVDEALIDSDTREAIRKELLELAKTLPPWKHRSIAPVLAKLFGEEIKTLRQGGHSWDSIVKIIRKHGLHVSRTFLKTSSQG